MSSADLSISSEKEKKNWSLDKSNERNETERSYFGQIVSRFLKHRLAVAGLIFFILLIFIAIFAPILAPHDPYVVSSTLQSAPSAEHWLGTDAVGRDVLSRLIYASRVSLLVGVGSVAIYVLIGTIVGAFSGYFGGWLDMVFMRMTDIFMSFPSLMVMLVLVSIIGPSMFSIILILALFAWTGVARLVRGSVLSLKQMDYIKANVALGINSWRILFGHIIPNCISPIIVNATFGIAGAIITEASLSFLGLGIQPPTASWGNMLTEAQSITVLTEQPWLWLPSGLMIVLAVLAINFVGDGLRDALDPKSFK